MEYIYAAMLLHKAGQQINEDGVKKVLEAAGAKPDASRIKALVAALDGVNIEEAIQKAVIAPVAAAPAEASKEKPKEEKKEDPAEDKKREEQAAAGLGALFG
ncbi:MAG: 50S ribosomal protein P1 [Nanoarchaeota archaeon]|nr:50S ribosomal protein P1 [Nanoarchaeota archaeon]